MARDHGRCLLVPVGYQGARRGIILCLAVDFGATRGQNRKDGGLGAKGAALMRLGRAIGPVGPHCPSFGAPLRAPVFIRPRAVVRTAQISRSARVVTSKGQAGTMAR